jgi:hypothetical protein
MCEEKHRLVKEYAAAAKVFSKVAFKLQGLTGEELKNALEASEAARLECGNARDALLRHKTEHRCNGPLMHSLKARVARSGAD